MMGDKVLMLELMASLVVRKKHVHGGGTVDGRNPAPAHR